MKYVYFIKPVGAHGPIKIGCSANPEQRLRHLTRKARPLQIVALIKGDYETERRFHALFRAHHIGKEWFAPVSDLLAVIQQVWDGVFDVDTLPAPQRLPRKPIEYTPERRRHMSEMARRHARWLAAYRAAERIAKAEGRKVWHSDVSKQLAESVRAA